MDPAFYTRTTLTAEQAAERDQVLGALTAATRELADAQLRTEVDLAEAAAVTEQIRALTQRLLVQAREGALGTELGPGRNQVRNHGNAVMGLRNPFASFLRDSREVTADKHLKYDVELGGGSQKKHTPPPTRARAAAGRAGCG